MSWFRRLQKREPLLRKGVSLLKQVPRFASRLGSRAAPQFCILANSFPKSGTHLLVQVLEGLPGVRNYDSFIASVPPIRFVERTDRVILRRIGWIVPGEMVSAHLYYKELYVRRLVEKGAAIFFIYRDPRDVVISEAHYLTYMNRWHRAHRYFAHHLHTDADRIMASIRGIPREAVGYDFPNIAERFRPYTPWISDEHALGVRFEDLVGVKQRKTVRRIVGFAAERIGEQVQLESAVNECLRRIDPSRSRTFREGKTGAWRETFSDEHSNEMKRVAGDLLIGLGYERDRAW